MCDVRNRLRTGRPRLISLGMTILPVYLLALAPPPVLAAGETTVKICVAQATIRLEPARTSPAVATPPTGAVLKVVATRDDWYLVSLPDDGSGFQRTGWVHRSVVEPVALVDVLTPTDEPPAQRQPSADLAQNRSPKDAPESKGERPTARVPAAVASDDGLYYTDGQTVRRVEAKTPYQTRTGNRLVSWVTLGIKPARLNAMMPGLAADFQVGQSPSFYLHLAEAEQVGQFYLIRFTVKENRGRREIEVGAAAFFKVQAGLPEKDLLVITSTRVAKNIYVIQPASTLPSGEYGLLLIPTANTGAQTPFTPTKIFDFGVR